MASVKKLEAHKTQLENKHKELDSQIKIMYKAYEDDLDINQLKKEKLAIKREIETISEEITKLTKE